MALLYANRGFISVNNQKLIDVKSIELKLNRNAKAVPSMTVDGFNTGITLGNWEIDFSFEIAVEDQLSSPKLELIDWSTVSGQLTAAFGNASDLWTLANIFNKDMTTRSPAPGDEVTKSWNFGALKMLDGAGNSSLFGSLFS